MFAGGPLPINTHATRFPATCPGNPATANNLLRAIVVGEWFQTAACWDRRVSNLLTGATRDRLGSSTRTARRNCAQSPGGA
eukprot:2632597-Lingulodinium_polyedra.AAC.1